MSMGAGAFMGINASTSREDMLRAMGLGLCYEFARVFGELKVSGEIDRIVLGGGASKGKHFQAILAGLFAPAKTLVVEDQDLAGPRGAVYAFSRAAARSKTHSVALPDKKTREQLNAGLSRYCDLFDMAYGKDHPIGGAYHFKD
jgi:sugar (pentulose or hexulose) kinase